MTVGMTCTSSRSIWAVPSHLGLENAAGLQPSTSREGHPMAQPRRGTELGGYSSDFVPDLTVVHHHQ